MTATPARTVRAVLRLALPGVLAATGAPLAPLAAQGPPPPSRPVSFEVRADLLAAHETTLHAGGAILWPVGRAVRLGVQAGGGVTGLGADRVVEAHGATAARSHEGEDPTVASGRVELVARFELDPFAEREWGLYGAAGGGVLAARDRAGRAIVFVVAGVERRTRSRLSPALELGLGGGARLGVVLRRR